MCNEQGILELLKEIFVSRPTCPYASVPVERKKRKKKKKKRQKFGSN